METAEIHLATGWQNALYDHPAFPAALRAEVKDWVRANAADERKPDQTEDQFLYSSRKKAIGPFKRQLWELETKHEILVAAAAKIGLPVRPAPRHRHAGDDDDVRQARRRRAADPGGPGRRGRLTVRTP